MTQRARAAADLRDKLLWLLEQPTPAGEAARAHRDAWRAFHPGSQGYADEVAQVVACAPDGAGPVAAAARGALDNEPLASAVEAEIGRVSPGVVDYADFLGAYDKADRRVRGAWYTPAPLVRAMVAMVDRLLVARFGLATGFADPAVLTVDPAVGPGTFPLAILDRRPGAVVRGFEIAPAPCSVAQDRLAGRADITLGDALASSRGDDRAVTVVIGNPPYRRVTADGCVGIADLLDVARQHTVFSHHASLYNLYVAFWRWAIRRAFEPDRAGVVAFVTASSWLTGPGFVGLRQLVRETCDEVFVLDLADGDLFRIGTPVAVVVLARSGGASKTVRYRRLAGSRDAKLAELERIAGLADPFAGDWLRVPDGLREPLVPRTDGTWSAWPALADLFPWQQPGCKFGRTWPVAPSAGTLRRRWSAFVSAPVDRRPGLFYTGSSGRNVHSRVAGLPRLADEPADASPRPIRRYGYRPFDRQWAFDDPRLAKTESPSLWRSVSDRQVFLIAPMTKAVSAGPCATVTAVVPDLHAFRGSFGGKDVLPLYRDAAATAPNVTAGLLPALGAALGMADPTPEDLLAFVYAILSAPAYQERFAVELDTPGPRVPIPRDAALWGEAVALGRRLVALHTFREAPPPAGVRWESAVKTLPSSPRSFDFDAKRHRLRIGDGVLVGVRPEVWTYAVSGMLVVKKWLAYRTATGAGRAASSTSALDAIRPSAWSDEWSDELVELIRVLTATIEAHPAQADLLRRICDGPTVDDLPTPVAADRLPP